MGAGFYSCFSVGLFNLYRFVIIRLAISISLLVQYS